MHDLDSTALLRGEIQADCVQDLDKFCSRLYTYYLEGGFWCLLARRIFTLASFGFTWLLTAFLLLFVDWSSLIFDCNNDDTCASISPLRPFPSLPPLTPYTFFISLYLGVFHVWWLWLCVRYTQEVWECLDMKHFYNHKLGFPDHDIQTMEWHEITEKLEELQRTNALCFAQELTALNIANRIMRRENYLIAMLNRNVLDVSVPTPSWLTSCNEDDGDSYFADNPDHHPTPSGPLLFTKVIEWNISLCILDPMLDSTNSKINKSFVNDATALKRRIAVLAALNLVLCPFILLGVLNYFFLKYAEKLKHRPMSFATRSYTPKALWDFREFNELHHVFERRIARSIPRADTYVEQFPSRVLSLAAQFVSFVAGSFVAVMLAIGLVNNDVLLFYKVPNNEDGMNLLWYLAIFTMLATTARSFVVDKTTQGLDRASLMQAIELDTHHSPPHWKGRLHSRDVYDEFVSMYCFKAQLFFEEILSIFLTPFILYFSLRNSASKILAFIRDFTEEVDGLGDVCSFATFNFQQNGDSRYGAATACSQNRQSRMGKMEKSFLNFKANHPQWNVAGGDELIAAISAQTPPQTHTNTNAHSNTATSSTAAPHFSALQTSNTAHNQFSPPQPLLLPPHQHTQQQQQLLVPNFFHNNPGMSVNGQTLWGTGQSLVMSSANPQARTDLVTESYIASLQRFVDEQANMGSGSRMMYSAQRSFTSASNTFANYQQPQQPQQAQQSHLQTPQGGEWATEMASLSSAPNQ